MKRITITWTFILIIIIACLTIFGFHIKEKEIDNLMEKEIINQTEKYLGLYTNLYPTLGNTKKITVDELKDNGYDPKLDENCTGYIIIENTNMGFKYNPYIKCPDYETEGYKND